jgi:ABC-type phosphate transport system substrate-binding protein
MVVARGLIITLAIILGINHSSAEIAVVVNPANPINNLPLDQLRKIYLGKVTTFPSGDKIVLGESKAVKKEFYKKLLGWNMTKVKKHWISVVFSGEETTPPKELKGKKDILEFLRRHPGAICIVDYRQVTKDMKVVAIDGRYPWSEDYPLR